MEFLPFADSGKVRARRHAVKAGRDLKIASCSRPRGAEPAAPDVPPPAREQQPCPTPGAGPARPATPSTRTADSTTESLPQDLVRDGPMKHAGARALDSLEPLLILIRSRTDLVERRRGVFYRGGAAFLHFHEDPAGLFADMKVDGTFRRSPVNAAAQQSALLRRAVRLAAGVVRPSRL